MNAATGPSRTLAKMIGGATMLAMAMSSLQPSHAGMTAEPWPVEEERIVGTIPWLSSAEAWTETAAGEVPIIECKNAGGEVVATGRVAMTDDLILLHVVVKDAVHHNEKQAANIWRGDSLQIGIDASGCAATSHSHRQPVLPEVASISAALAGDEAVIWTHYHGKYDAGYIGSGGERAYFRRVEHDAAAGRTEYELRLPWSEFATSGGLYPTLGLALQINDVDAESGQRTVCQWGGGAGGKPLPERFNLLRVGPPPKPRLLAQVVEATEVYPGDMVKALIAVPTNGPAAITSAFDAGGETLNLSAEQGRNLRRLRIRTDVPARANEADVEATVWRISVEADDATSTLTTAPIVRVHRLVAHLQRKLRGLAAITDQPLLADHFRSVDAVVQAEWAKAALAADEDKQPARILGAAAQAMLDDFDGPAQQWSTYLNGERPLIHAWLSPRDRAISFYLYYLPKGWEPRKAYPLYLELHGAGASNPMMPFATWFQRRPAGETPPKTYAQIARDGYAVHPFNRGNTGYHGIGEVDVWEVYDDVHRRFVIDPRRRYLYGFSMGGGGTWSIATRRPDLWAAVGIFAGSMRRVPRGIGIGRNLGGTPVWLAAGEQDRLFPQNVAIHDEMTQYGVEHEWTPIPDVGHKYVGGYQARMHAFLQKHRRTPPREARYIAYAEGHDGAWGITLQRDPAVNPMPHFAFRIDGRSLRLTTEGSRSVSVDLSQMGFDGDEPVRVVWNGRDAYQGAVTTVTLEQE